MDNKDVNKEPRFMFTRKQNYFSGVNNVNRKNHCVYAFVYIINIGNIKDRGVT